MLDQALRLQQDAARAGFDWPELEPLWDKLAEELAELREATAENPARMTEELGDLLFTVVNLARHLGVDPAAALTVANAKFRRRYAHVMQAAGALPPPGDPRRLAAMDARWEEAKRLGL